MRTYNSIYFFDGRRDGAWGAIPIFGTDGAQHRASGTWGTWGTRGARPAQILAIHCKKQNISLSRFSTLQGCSSFLKIVENRLNVDFVPHHT